MNVPAWYLPAWAAACLLAICLLLQYRGGIELFQRRYWRFLLQRWKLISFLVAASLLTLLAPLSNDPTWDRLDAAMMSALTYATAPWAVGTLHRAVHGRAPWPHAWVAACLGLFSASWFYDLYILLRDGAYPVYWLPNLFLSGLLYVCAGLLWNLQWSPARGVGFQFARPCWPEPDTGTRFARIVWHALPFMIVAVAVIVPFLW